MIDTKKSIIAWSMYDWANSSFATTVIAGFFPIFFKTYWADQENIHTSTFYLGITHSAAAFLVALAAPFLGAIADRGCVKKNFLFFFTFLAIIMTCGLYFVQKGSWCSAVLIFVLAAIGYNSGLLFYDSLLPSVASKKNIDFTSSLGFALGYIGGGLLFLLNVSMYLYPHLFGLKDNITAVRVSFVTVGLWWALFSIPLWLWVKEPMTNTPIPMKTAMVQGFHQLINTLKHIRQLRVVALFLVAYWLYIDGVNTIFRMGVDYGISLGFPTSSLITALLMVQFISFPSALLYYAMGSRIGIKKAIIIAIGGYSSITVLGFFMNAVWQFYVLAALIGLFQGGIQALSRSLYTRIIPLNHAAEFFGFYNMVGKFAAIIGPGLMGMVTVLTGNIRYGILSILLLLVPGALLLIKTNIREGQEMIKDYSQNEV